MKEEKTSAWEGLPTLQIIFAVFLTYKFIVEDNEILRIGYVMLVVLVAIWHVLTEILINQDNKK